MRRGWIVAGVVVVASAAGLMRGFQTAQAQTEVQKRDALAQARNLGKAFYENPTTQIQAVDEFKKALALNPDSTRERINYGLALLRAAKTAEGIAELEKAQKQDPSIPHTWFNLAVAYKRDSQYSKAITQFEQMAKLVPDEPMTHYNLGFLYKLDGRAEQALAEFETATKLNPNLAGPHFQLFNGYRQLNRTADATREQQIFQDIKKRQAGAAVAEDLEWSFFAEIFDPAEATSSVPAEPAKPIKLTARELATGFDAATAGLEAVDVDGDGSPEIVAWSLAGVKVFKAGVAMDAGLGLLKDVVSIAAGDFNNDGLTDLAVLTTSGAELWANRKGRFEKTADVAKGKFNKAVWLDFDHDYDLDLALVGEKSVLIRNNGAAGFSDESKSFPFVDGVATDAALFDITPDTDGVDLVVSYAGRAGVLYRDKLAGKYVAEDLASIPASARLGAADMDNDGATDLIIAAGGKAFVLGNRAGVLTKGVQSDAPAGAFAVIDFENRGLADLALSGAVIRHEGSGAVSALDKTVRLLALTNPDGHTDLAAITSAGSLILLKNETESKYGWMVTTLQGVKNPKTAYGAKVEVKTGALYQKRTYTGLPLVFGIRHYAEAETVRITWPNGLIQNEVHQAAKKAYTYKEAQRLSGSCPMIFTWNGRNFTFLTDVLGVAPLGASAGDGKYFPVDHDEYVSIPGEAMVLRNGQYEIRVTEELKEVSYLDRMQLIAVDHPAGKAIYSNDKFKSPPFPEFRLFGVEKALRPKSARDEQGHDVLAKVLRKDGQYADSFARDYKGVAAMHSLTLDFGTAAPDNKAVLVLAGWVDWADGSTFLGASQESKDGLVMPYLQVKNAKGEWQTVIADMGMPAGKPKTIAVDLTGKFLSASREVRISSSLALYWDEAFLSEDVGPPETVITPLDAHSADLHFRGFSKAVIDAERRQPENFLYDQVSPVSQWNPTAGNYTRYGDVRELIGATDDRLLLMGSGDEVTLLFDPAKLPALKTGWKRDFLLLVDGWAKDADANTAFSKTVEPLPFHGMSTYPYPASDSFPRDTVHNNYRVQFNTRPALRLLRPLNTKGGSTNGIYN